MVQAQRPNAGHGSFPEVGEEQKAEKKRKKKKVGENNGQLLSATTGDALKQPGPI